MAVYYPMDSTFVCKGLLLGFSLSLVISIFATDSVSLMNDHQQSIGLCIPLWNTGHPFSLLLLTIFIVAIASSSSILIPIIYRLIIIQLKKGQSVMYHHFNPNWACGHKISDCKQHIAKVKIVKNLSIFLHQCSAHSQCTDQRYAAYKERWLHLLVNS